MSDEKKDIRFKKAFMGGFKRQSVAVYIEELQKELFESRAEASRAVKDFEEYRVKESVLLQKAALESDENSMLRKELEETRAKLAEVQNRDRVAEAAGSVAAETSAIETELLRERGVSESLRLDVAELKKQLSEEYSANELLAAAINDKNGEIAELNEKIAEAENVAGDCSEAERIREEAAAEIERVRSEAAAEIETAKSEAAAEIETAKSEAATEIETAKSEAAAELERAKSEAAAEIDTAKSEAAAELEKVRAEAESLRAELEKAERLANEARETARAYSDTTEIQEPEKAEETEAESFETAEAEGFDNSFESVEAAPAEQTEEDEAAPEDIIPTDAPTENLPELEAEEVIPQEVTPEVLREAEELRTEPEKADEKPAQSGAPTVYDKNKIADIIARYTNIRNQSEKKQ